MNKAIIIGRVVRDPECSNVGSKNTALAKYTLAVPRRGDDGADFINCVAWGKSAEFAQKYMKKGGKFVIEGRIQTGSYTKQDGTKVYTTDIIVESQEFGESKSEANQTASNEVEIEDLNAFANDFMSIPDNVDDIGLPFN